MGQAISRKALSVMIKSAAFRADPDAVWHHALIAGMYGKQMATQLDRNTETQSMCGLLHSIGKPFLFHLEFHDVHKGLF